MRILKETELRKVKVLGSGAFGTVYKVRRGQVLAWLELGGGGGLCLEGRGQERGMGQAGGGGGYSSMASWGPAGSGPQA